MPKGQEAQLGRLTSCMLWREMVSIRISSRLSRLSRFRIAVHTGICLLCRRRIALFRHGANGIRPRRTIALASQRGTADGATAHH